MLYLLLDLNNRYSIYGKTAGQLFCINMKEKILPPNNFYYLIVWWLSDIF
jgi:hypothetical protein